MAFALNFKRFERCRSGRYQSYTLVNGIRDSSAYITGNGGLMRISSLLAILATFAATIAGAQESSDPLAEYKWIARPLVVFADSEFDPTFVEQMELLAEDPSVLEDRDVVVLTDTDPDANGPLRQTLHPNNFTLVLIDKMGNIVFRKPAPWTPREISRAIDKLPIRRDELNKR